MIILYRAFNVDIANYFKPYRLNNEQYYECGGRIYNLQESCVKRTLEEYLLVDRSIDASKMSKDWFPKVNADVFISHSHKDIQDVITFAGWLKKELGLTAFVDSLVWGYADDLLKNIDNEYCQMDNGHYSYEKRNISTSHVHMMLQVALMQMMCKTECIFFINTPNSIKFSDNFKKSSTYSPWIYSELSFINCIKECINKIDKIHQIREDTEFPNFKYDVDISQIPRLCMSDLYKWQDECESKKYSKEDKIDLLDKLTKQLYGDI